MVEKSHCNDIVIPESLRKEYPFRSHFHSIEIKGQDLLQMHFVDEGPKKTDPILMIHGNPTWSFTYRNLIKSLKESNRTIAVDHIGCGLSDKPQNYSYQLQNHIENLESLVNTLKLTNITLIVHDWGGAIGFGLATRNPHLIKRVVILNTAAFESNQIPRRINFCRLPFIGEKLVRHFNAFAWPATFMGVTHKLPKVVKQGYLLPYNNYKNRIATSRFVQDIPLEKNHPTFKTIKNIEKNLFRITCPKLILWGGKDFCFNNHFYDRWKEIYPTAKTHYFKKAGHFVIEDEKEEVLCQIKAFLNSNRPNSF